ncbi:MAG: lysophospholipid acyltransferase family protein [Candidatus Binatia bacterium]
MGVAQWERRAVAAPGIVDARTLARRVGEKTVYLALRVLWALLGAAGLQASRRVLEAVAALFARLDRRHRHVVEDNLDIAFPQMDRVVRESILEESFRNWGRIGAEAIHSDRVIDHARRSAEWHALAAAVAEGRANERGLLVLTAHIGNFEMLARIFGTLVAPVAVFHRPLGIVEVDSFLIRERLRTGVTTLGRGAAVRDAMRILAAGGCVAIPLDQNQREGRGIFVDVLGHPACTTTVLARLSLATGAPILPVFGVWRGEETVPVIGELVVPPPGRVPLAERVDWLRRLTERCSGEVDRVVRRFPHQWNWAHRRWKTRPPGIGECAPPQEE